MQWNRGYKPAHLWEGPGLTPWRNHRKQLRAKFRQGNDGDYLLVRRDLKDLEQRMTIKLGAMVVAVIVAAVVARLA